MKIFIFNREKFIKEGLVLLLGGSVITLALTLIVYFMMS